MKRSSFKTFCVAAIISFGAPAIGASRFVPGEILVCPARGRQADALATLHARHLEVLQTDPYSGLMRVRIDVGKENQALLELGRLAEIRYAELNGIGSGGMTPNDTSFGLQWHLENTGQSGGTPGADIECKPAWDLTTGSSSIGIAVLDTGIQSNHPEFAGRIASNGTDVVNSDSNPEGDHPHGTWVSGCIAANANNTFAVVGVDWNCTIIPVKVLNQNNQGTIFWLTQGLNYAAAQTNVQIINMSLVNYPSSASIITALQNARDAGKILIACAGNGGIGNADVSYPGASPLTISIGYTNNMDVRPNLSATGHALDFVAPGLSVVTVKYGTLDDATQAVSGCSFATPLVSGLAGLLLARAQSFGMTLDQDAVYELLKAGAEDQVGPASEDTPGWDEFFGHGRINAYQSLLALVSPCPADLTLDGTVDVDDLLELINAWGECPAPCAADLVPTPPDGVVDVDDLLELINSWGDCS